MQQDDIEESARAELWKEELIEEIEQKVGGLRELEEAGKKQDKLVMTLFPAVKEHEDLVYIFIL